jgi:hypothetical protein
MPVAKQGETMHLPEQVKNLLPNINLESIQAEAGESRVKGIAMLAALSFGSVIVLETIGCQSIKGQGPHAEVTKLDLDAELDTFETPANEELVRAHGTSSAAVHLADRSHFTVFGWHGPSNAWNATGAQLTKREMGVKREGYLQLMTRDGAITFDSYKVPKSERQGFDYGIIAKLNVNAIDAQVANPKTVKGEDSEQIAYYDPSVMQHVLGNVASSTEEALDGGLALGEIADNTLQENCKDTNLSHAGLAVGASIVAQKYIKGAISVQEGIPEAKQGVAALNKALKNPIRVKLQKVIELPNGQVRTVPVSNFDEFSVPGEHFDYKQKLVDAIDADPRDIDSVRGIYDEDNNCSVSAGALKNAPAIFAKAAQLTGIQLEGVTEGPQY